MVATFDSVGPSSSGFTSAATPYQWSHTLGAGATLLIVGVACGTDGNTLTVTAGGVPMTTNAGSNLWKRHTNDSTAGFGQIYVLPAPPTGTITIAVSGATTGDRISGGSIALAGTPLDSTAYGTPVSAVGSSASASVNVPTTASSSLVVAFMASGQGAGAVSGTSTSRFVANGDTNSGAGNGAGQTAPGTGGSVTMSRALTSDFWAIFGIEVLAGAAPPGVPPVQPGSRAWRNQFRRDQAKVIAVSQDVVVTAGLAAATGTAGDVSSATTMTPTPPQQLGGETWKRHWRNPMVPWYRFQEQPYIAGLAGGGRGYFVDQYGNPRLVWGDAVWALCGNVGRWNGGNWRADFDQFTTNRAAQGFTVLYGKPMGTLQSSNIDNNGGTFDSLFPFQGGAPATGTAGANPSTGLTEAYWQRIDYFLAVCKAKGLTFFMNAVGYSSDFQSAGPLAGKSASEFQAYGTALGSRYKNQPNLVWMVADDYFGGSDSLLDGFLTGLRGAGDTHVIAIQNMPESTSRFVAQVQDTGCGTTSGSATVTDLNAAATYVGATVSGSGIPAGAVVLSVTPGVSFVMNTTATATATVTLSLQNVQAAWGTSNAAFNWTYSYNQEYYGVEQAYAEGAPVPVVQGDGYFYQGNATYAGGSGAFAFDQAFRQAAWWALAAGARGKVHGSESIWQYQSTALASSATDWFYAHNALAIRTAVEGLAGWQNLLPDLSGQLVTAGRGTRATVFTSGGGGGQYEPAFTSSYVAASITPDHSLALLYLPRPTTITVDVTQLGQGFTANWIDPVTGALSSAGSGPAFNSTAQGNNSQGDPDWALVLQGPPITPTVVVPPQPGSTLWRRRFIRDQQPMTAPAPASADLQVNAGLAIATGAALAPGTGLTPPASSGAGSSFAPGIGLQGGSASSSGVAQAPGVQLATGLASGTGSAQAGQAGSGGQAGLAAGTGAAPAAGVELAPGLAAATGTAQSPQAGNAASTTAAGGTGSAFAPGIGLTGGSASSSGVAQAPGVQLGAGLASGSGTAPAEGVGLTPGLATGTGTAFNPGTSIGGDLQVNAGLAGATGTALAPGIGLTGGGASSSGVVQSPGVQLTPGLAHGTSSGQAVSPASAASAATATGTGTAQAPQAGEAAAAGVATGAGAVQGASRALAPALATAAGTAQSPSLAVAVTARGAVALGQVLNATAQGQAAVIKGYSSATSVTEPMMSTGAAVTQPAQSAATSVSAMASSQGGVT